MGEQWSVSRWGKSTAQIIAQGRTIAKDLTWQDAEQIVRDHSAAGRLAIAERLLTVERQASSEREQRMRAALSFARGTLEDIGSSLIPVADRDTLARRARDALVALDALSETGPAGPGRGADDEPERCPECHTADRVVASDFGGTCVICWRRRNGEIPPRIPIKIEHTE